MPISKTDFIRALQCKKMLWLDAHAPEYKIIPPEVQARLDAGNEFGDNAMGIFGEFTETTTYREDGRLYYAAMIAKTQQLRADKTPVICEAACTWYGNFCAADILRRQGDGYILYEVKNTYTARQEFVTDLGFGKFNAVFLQSLVKTKVGHDGGDHSVVVQLTVFLHIFT